MIRALAFTAAVVLLAACGDDGDTPVPEPLCLSCFDGDPCTDDRCDPTTGQCVFIPRDAARACTQDRHCDDRNACTVDACATDAECGFMRCRNERLPDCRTCDEGCDDGDHCTTETCGADGFCDFVREPLCAPRCSLSRGDLQGPSFLHVGPATLQGMAFSRQTSSCATACACAGELLMSDSGAFTPLVGEADWTCAFTGLCDGAPAVTCQPLRHGRQYLVWGEALAAPDGVAAFAFERVPAPTDASVPTEPSAPASFMRPEGFCLVPHREGVAGSYRATLALDGEAERRFLITLDRGGVYTISEGGDLEVQLGPFEAWSQKDVRLSLTLGDRAVTAQLYPNAHRLAGPVSASTSLDGADRDPAIPEPTRPRIGTLTLELE